MTLVWFALVSVGLLSLSGVLWSLWKIWQERFSEDSKRFERRIQGVRLNAAAGHQITTRERLLARQDWLHQWLSRWTWMLRLDRELTRAGVSWLVVDMLLATLGMAALGLSLFAWLDASPLVCLVGMLLIGGLPSIALSILERRHQSTLEYQLPEVLEFIARSMQAGHAFSSALQMAASESPAPIGKEFQTAFNQVNLGLPVQQALTGLAERIDCTDMRYFSVAVLINREVGGDLADLLRNVAELIRVRIKLRLSIRAMTAEGRVSAWVLGLLPFILGGLLFLINPGYIAPLWQEPAGRQWVLYALILMALGIFWMTRIARVKI